MLQSIPLAIAIFLLVLCVPYLIAIWNLRHTTMRCMQLETIPAKDIPEHLKPVFKRAIAELKPLGFKVVSCHEIAIGAEKDGNQWGVLLQHLSEQTYAGFMSSQLVNSEAPLTLSLATFLEDGTQLNTVNVPNYRIYSPDPREIAQHHDGISIAEQWEIHRQRLEEPEYRKRIVKLSVEEYLQQVVARNGREGFGRLVENKEVVWVKSGKSYRMTWRTAIKAVYNVVRQQKKASPQSKLQAIAEPNTSPSATPNVALEIAEFYRLEQKEKRGTAKRGKNWLLLGTLALFIASYSSIFDPLKLIIFIAVLLLHEGGHLLAMKLFGYRDTVLLFIPFLGALATARKENATLTEKVWISLAGPLPGLILGIALAIAFTPALPDSAAAAQSATSMGNWYAETNWVREASWMLIVLNLFNLLPVYPLDGGQVADLLLFSRNPYIGILFKGVGVLLLALLGLTKPLLLVFALLIALSIPTSFRLAKLNSSFRKDLQKFPQSDRDELLRFLFTQLQHPPYRTLSFAQKRTLVLGLLDVHQENGAKLHARVGLTTIYLSSLLFGFIGSLYALVPNFSLLSNAAVSMVNPEAAYRQRAQQQLAAADRALRANPQNVQSYIERGRAKFWLKRHEEAIADANHALQIDPNSGEAYHLRGMARQAVGDAAGAADDRSKGSALIAQQQLTTINQRLQKNPNDAQAYLDRASLRYAQKRFQDAITDSNRALLVNPQNALAIVMRGEAYLALNKLPEAMGNANHALRLDPNLGEAYDLRSRVRHKLGDSEGAIADEQTAERLFEAEEDALDN